MVMAIQKIKIIRINMNGIFSGNNIKIVNIVINIKEWLNLIILDLIRSIKERRATTKIK